DVFGQLSGQCFEFVLVHLLTHEGILLKKLLIRGRLHNWIYRLGLLRLGEPIYVFPDRIVKHVSLLFRSLILLIEKTFFSYLKWCCDYQRQLFPYLSKKYPVFSARGQENHLIASDPTL
ncbi:hypothetical protein, partial [Aeromonas caviae]|uniref:hypothetical protein n=2 Tax=Gammaproteobacteria TaxID=1236 RepID=UPI0038CF7C18